MCGLSGALGRGINLHIIRHLATLNESRGRMATGFFNGKGSIIKNNDPATTFLRDENLRKWLEASADLRAICCHTRFPTRGANTIANAHPFAYGEWSGEGENRKFRTDIVGSHNGCIWSAPNEYDVDSMYAFALLNIAEPGDYQGALGDVEGNFVLTWLDLRENAIYLLNWRGSLAMYQDKKNEVLYYSSDKDHLETALGCKVTRDTTSGDVYRYDIASHRLKKLKDFKGQYGSKPVHRSKAWSYDSDDYSTPYVTGFRGHRVQETRVYTGRIKKFDPKENGRIRNWWYAEVTSAGHTWWTSVERLTTEFFDRKFSDYKIGEFRVPGYAEIRRLEAEAEAEKARTNQRSVLTGGGSGPLEKKEGDTEVIDAQVVNEARNLIQAEDILAGGKPDEDAKSMIDTHLTELAIGLMR